MSEPSAAPNRERPILLWALALGLALAAVGTHPEYESDPFWHMSLGREVLRDHARTVPEEQALPGFVRPAVVPEWGWAVLTYLLHQAGSWHLLVAWVCLLAVVTGVGLVLLARAFAGRADLGPVALTSGWAAGQVALRMRLRPEMINLALLPVGLLLARRFLQAEVRARLRWGLALVLLEVGWAQLHGSFVLLGPAVGALALPALLREGRQGKLSILALGGALALGLLTSAYGAQLFSYLGSHDTGDAKEHTAEMIRTPFAALHPDGLFHGSGFYLVLMALLGLAGMLLERELWGSEVLLALVGAVLGTRVLRFLPVAAIFFLPLAARGAAAVVGQLRAGRLWDAPLLLLGVVGWSSGASAVAHAWGPFFRVGPAPGVYPEAAARYLAQAPGPVRAVTSHAASAPLAFWLAGKARVYIDGRAPLYFDDAEYGASRDALQHGPALGRVLQRYQANAAVLLRTEGACADFPAGWAPVVVEATYSTFAPAGQGQALRALSPCGPEYLTAEACAEGGARLDAEVEAMAKLAGETPFVRYLRAERIVRCGGDLAQVPKLVTDGVDGAPFSEQGDRVWARWALAKGQPALAVDVLSAQLAAGDPLAWALAGPVLESSAVPAGQARAVVEALVRRQDDQAKPELRALLARLCAAQGDARCVRMQGLRAAVGGCAAVAPALKWLREHPASEQDRVDAEAWLGVLAGEPAPVADGGK